MATQTLLQMKSTFWSHQDQLWTGIASAGDATSLTDPVLANLVSDSFPAPLRGRQVVVTSGSASGAVRQVQDVDATEGRLLVSQGGWGASVAASNTYELWGNGLHDTMLTRLFNDALRKLHPTQWDQVTVVTNQRIYDVSTLVRAHTDVLDVAIRVQDPANLAPYVPTPIWWDAWDDTGAGTHKVILHIQPMTNQTTIQLWLQHKVTFAAFTSNSSTVDDVYADWLVWEAILLYAQRQRENTSVDKKEWDGRIMRAITELRPLRSQFNPRMPVQPRPPFAPRAIGGTSHMVS